ncbi:hypothetical protein B1964_23245 [Gordonia sp. i37]|nr:hypothetical protein B1964_23245 [Gordonia sp. i37]
MVTDTLVGHLIGGRWRSSGPTTEVTDPGRIDDVVGVIADADADVVDAAVASAVAASHGWEQLATEDRVAALARGVAAAHALAPSLATLLVRENGALYAEASTDIARGLALATDTLLRAPRFLADTVRVDESSSLVIARDPVGPTALIVPWNSPMVLALSKVAPALVAGNTVVVKPSPLAPLALSRLLGAIAAELPDGVLNIVNGDAAGAMLTAHRDIRAVSFTGGTDTGRKVAAAAAGTVKRVGLELGGNDPALILDDADIDELVDRLCRGVFTRAGQICFGVKRIYVARTRATELVEAMTGWLEKCVVGHGLDEGVVFGPLISAAQRARVITLVDSAERSGATIHRGGRYTAADLESRGHYLLPTVVTGISADHPLVVTEQFGPAIPIIAYDSVDDAVMLANDSEYGLASSVWSTDQDRAMAVARRVSAGCGFINSHNVWSLSFDMPFGGVKQSGIGRERADCGLAEFVEEHAIRSSKPTQEAR